jgi:hypothetical protein
MNAAFTHYDFLRIVHRGAVSPGLGRFKHKVSLTFARAHRCLMI